MPTITHRLIENKSYIVGSIFYSVWCHCSCQKPEQRGGKRLRNIVEEICLIRIVLNLKVIWENKRGIADEMPHLVYISREKRPTHPHHYKAGAMNVLVRIVCFPNIDFQYT